MSVDIKKVGSIFASVCQDSSGEWGWAVKVQPSWVAGSDPEEPALSERISHGSSPSKDEAKLACVKAAADCGAPFSIWSFIDDEEQRLDSDIQSDCSFQGTIFIANR